jgi:hypothetical protein
VSNPPPIKKEATQHEPIVSESLKDGVRKNREQIAEARKHDDPTGTARDRRGSADKDETSR